MSLGTDRRVDGVLLRDGRTIPASAVVVTTGTFLNGLAHVGESQYSCGRNGEAPSQLLGDQLRSLGLQWTRLKTGTPPRLDGRTIDWSQFEPQPGDANPTPFSFLTEKIERAQIDQMDSRRHAFEGMKILAASDWRRMRSEASWIVLRS